MRKYIIKEIIQVNENLLIIMKIKILKKINSLRKKKIF